jgi:predicted O-methyltransferase YrrM
MSHWARALKSIAKNVWVDGRRDNRFEFTKQWLSFGLNFDSRQKAAAADILDILPDAASLTVPMGDVLYSRSNANPYELYCLCCLAMATRPRNIFEFGTFDGATTLRLAHCCPESKIYTLDLAPEDIEPMRQGDLVKHEVEHVRGQCVGARLQGTPEAARVTQLLGDSTRFDYSPFAGEMDFIFIDACHEYEYVRKDTQSAMLMLRPGGMIVWHDYEAGWPGVVRAVDEFGGRTVSGKGDKLWHVKGTALAVYCSPAVADTIKSQSPSDVVVAEVMRRA